MAATKVKQADLPAIKQKLLAEQNGLCLFCGRDLTRTPPLNRVADHDHVTGIIRGVAHRGCNGAEGKILAALRYTGLKSKKEIAKLLEGLIKVWTNPPNSGLIYPTHKTPNEKRLARNKKARLARARKKKGK